MTEKSFEQTVKEIKGKKILVANRGITARRIIRSIREIRGIPVLTVSDVDKFAPFTAGAQELILLGKNPSAYLEIDLILKLAREHDIAAIHPGWGFASEDASFPEKCKDAGILFIGPPTEPMELLGNKVKVRSLARQLNIPVVPGSLGAVEEEEAREIALDMGLPVMLKAEGGGGGRGIYEIYDMEQLETAFSRASILAQASFGNPRIYVEKLLTSVRHIEIQVIADQYGNVFAFDERDCTVQRNHQKLVEITPSPWPDMSESLRTQLKEYAKALVSEVGYYSLATVEFLVDENATPYLIEVNTRLQVEHGITECRYGIDLVEEQIAVAFGSTLRFNESKTKPVAKVIQLRINCEDPKRDFAPNSGHISRYISTGGPGVRLDSCITGGYEFPSNYDSAASLLIAYGDTWGKTLSTMDRALKEYTIGGLKTTIPFHRKIISNPVFRSGHYDTKFIETQPDLIRYWDDEAENLRLSRLMAEISALGYNTHIQLSEYRGPKDKRVGIFEPVLPVLEPLPPSSKGRYARKDRQALIDYVRDAGIVHFCDTTARDITQSNSGNRFRVAEDRLIGPYLDRCGFFSIENGGGAHFHVAMIANMTYPFSEARVWNQFAPMTPKQILIRSTNLLGYKPQPKNLMQLTGEAICRDYDIIRCFDFLNHVDNMRPFAEVVLNSKQNVFQPAVSLSWAKGFSVNHYLGVVDAIVQQAADVAGVSTLKAESLIILGLKDMAGVCPPRFISALVTEIRKKYKSLVIHYHRHCTDGLFVPAVGAAAKAGAHIVDTAIGASVRWYGQGEVLSTAAYIEEELGLKTQLDKEMIRNCNFVLKQIMPYYDRYTAPYFQGIDHDVVYHGMPGGATSSSQEGAMKQGYIRLLPYMLKFLAGTRQIIKYHDVTPGSQITWNTAFLAVTSAFQRGGEEEVQNMLWVLDTVIETSESDLDDEIKKERLMLYKDSNDAFRNLLLGKFGKLPLGFPPDWVYESAFGQKYQEALASRTETSPLEGLESIDIKAETEALQKQIDRKPAHEELLMYLNHPGDAIKTILFRQKFGNANRVPLDVWFEGLESGREIQFKDVNEKPHSMKILGIEPPDDKGMSTVHYTLNGEVFSHMVKVTEPKGLGADAIQMADPSNPYHVGSPSNGDLWVMYVKPGDFVKAGEELFNITIMKQEKAVIAEVDGVVEKVLKLADYKFDKKMVPVKKGELLVQLGLSPSTCSGCNSPLANDDYKYCPNCGKEMSA